MGSDIESITYLDFDFEEACEVPARAQAIGAGLPQCPGRTAEWVGWRPNCCPQSPRYMLLCDPCKNIYQRWIAQHSYIVCGDCKQETGGFHTYTRLNKKS